MQKDGYRYLDLKPEEVLHLTHKEFFLMMEQYVEKQYDHMEMMSLQAMFMRVAHHSDKKNLKATDLFDREKLKRMENQPSEEELQEKYKRQQEILDNITIKER